jgi:energy-coupling factor transporter ATP-binding protein EcfA2
MPVKENKDMADTTIKIKNCNNITDGEITIVTDKLNILFGRNGSGKSTIAQAIGLVSKGKALSELAPYCIDNPKSSPSVEGVPSGYNVAIFNDDYVRQYVYQSDTLIKDAFEVLIRSPEYDEAKQNIDEALSKIKTTITGRQELINMQQQIGILINNIEFTGGSNKLAKRKGGIKGVLNGKGAYFNPPPELSEMEPFFEENTVSKWAAWRLQGYTEFGNKGKCPYCSVIDTEQTKTMNEVFVNSFDKASVDYASAIRKTLDALDAYLSAEKKLELLSLFGVKENLQVLETQLTKLGAEAKYLHDRLTTIVSFNGSSVDRNNISNLELQLSNMKIDLRACDAYFVSDLTKTEVEKINTEIDNLLTNVRVLQSEIAKYNTYIQKQAKSK